MAQDYRHIRVREVGDTKVVTFEGLGRNVDDEQNQREIGQELDSVAGSEKSPKVLLDFEDAEFIPWAYFKSRLLGLHKRILEAGGHLRIANLHPLTEDVLRVSRLDLVFHIHESVEGAHRAFSGPTPTASTGDEEIQSRVDERDAFVEGKSSMPASEGRTQKLCEKATSRTFGVGSSDGSSPRSTR